MARSRRRSSTRATVDYSVPSFRPSKTETSLCTNQSEAVCDIHDHHGTTAIAEEEAALEHSAALTAAKQAELLAQQRMGDIEAAAGVGTEALSLVSFTFISKSLTFDSLRQDIGQDKDLVHKDHLSLAVGYICFVVAFFAAIYSSLKYLRNIRRISTRYPFVQAGKWTFTVGMILGTLIMTVLVLAYTTMPH
ncbi:hypothetical protein BGZ95_000009 [Linnemannia exigua]|uniref:Uncharacterized protein n=1 Tax=Linnemannia exigua TaxID=604196 RepID=A0AAD4HCH5_9FUNG|nr:hypothetical protein BGZ95_000009 [Linnemannia exigua]